MNYRTTGRPVIRVTDRVGFSRSTRGSFGKWRYQIGNVVKIGRVYVYVRDENGRRWQLMPEELELLMRGGA